MPESRESDSSAVSASTRRFRAALSSANDRAVSSSMAPKAGTSSPLNVSSWRSRQPLACGSMMKACSPSKMPGSSTRPSQRNSRSGSATRTVGRKVIGLRLAGWAVTSSRAPTFASPVMRRMKGFHSG